MGWASREHRLAASGADAPVGLQTTTAATTIRGARIGGAPQTSRIELSEVDNVVGDAAVLEKAHSTLPKELCLQVMVRGRKFFGLL